MMTKPDLCAEEIASQTNTNMILASQNKLSFNGVLCAFSQQNNIVKRKHVYLLGRENELSELWFKCTAG